ncbi:hypothetical protein TRVL_01345 [Trypanosoma vivax]|nr:hypothetical protein TRVL_01345 [Trypanosoma vivax]
MSSISSSGHGSSSTMSTYSTYSRSSSNNSSDSQPSSSRQNGATPISKSTRARRLRDPVKRSLHPTTSFRAVKLNRDLTFALPDNCRINIPKGTSSVVQTVATDYELFPEGRYRTIDYFRAAVEMFLNEVRSEYEQQMRRSKKKDSSNVRFTWGNKGELAICFAGCCDMLKLLYDSFSSGHCKAYWNSIVGSFIDFLISESRIPQSVLNKRTYHTKYMDWRDGGTRYQGAQPTANVRFPSVSERRVKIETYLRTGSRYHIETSAVESPTGARAGPLSSSCASQVSTGNGVVYSSIPAHATNHAQSHPKTHTVRRAPLTSPLAGAGLQPSPMPPRSSPLVKVPAKKCAEISPCAADGKKDIDASGRVNWQTELCQIVGHSDLSGFPDDRLSMIPDFVRLCEGARTSNHIRTLVSILAASSVKVQLLFEQNGGVVVLRRLMDRLIHLCDSESMTFFLIHVLRMKLQSWSNQSKRSWLCDLLGNVGEDLKWLRTLEIVPHEEHQSWTDLVTRLEQRYVLSTSRERREQQQSGSKRTRPDREETLPPLTDGVGINKSAPCISTSFCVCLPGEFRAPLQSSEMEHNTVNFLNKKLQYCENAQRTWREKLIKALGERYDGSEIPLWYDIYNLLGVDIPNKLLNERLVRCPWKETLTD